MKLYKNQAGKVFGFEIDGSQDHLIAEDMVKMTDQEVAEHLAPEPGQINAVSMRQARLALDANGHLSQVESAVSGMSKAAQIEWEYASTVERGSALTQVMIDTLGLTAQQTDDLFIQAAGL